MFFFIRYFTSCRSEAVFRYFERVFVDVVGFSWILMIVIFDKRRIVSIVGLDVSFIIYN